MTQVRNWQLGREMSYPHAEVHPRTQFAFVFNTNRCIACQTCTMACRATWTFSRGQEYMWWNNVETKPYGGYPQSWDSKLLRMLEEANPGQQKWKGDVFGGQTIFEAADKLGGNRKGAAHALGYLPSDAEWCHPNIGEDVSGAWRRGPFGLAKDGAALPEHESWFFYLQRICNHCGYPACLAACPRKAIYKRPEDGIVLIDQERCRGYRKCVEACPYKKPMYRSTTRVTEKCVACYPRIDGKDPESDGVPMETRCMTSCVGRIRMQGLVKIDAATGDWAEDPQNPLYFLVKTAKVALPLYPQFGTLPNGYYIPPRWVSRAYLRQMFGPGVDHAIEAYERPSRELLGVLQLFRCTQKILYGYEIQEGPKIAERQVRGGVITVYNDTIIGYDRDGNEVVRTTVEEPFHQRPAERQNSI